MTILDNNENVFVFLIQNEKFISKTNNNVKDLKPNQKPLKNNFKSVISVYQYVFIIKTLNPLRIKFIKKKKNNFETLVSVNRL